MIVKNFKFLVSYFGTLDEMIGSARRAKSITLRTYSPEEIDAIIASELKKEHLEAANVQVTPVTIHKHNNGGSDTVELWYTVLCKKSNKRIG